MTMKTVLLTLGAIAVLVALWAMGVYNRLITLRNQVKNAWGQIDVQLQRRYDLIPNLVESVKGYMNFEKGTLEAVIQARNQAAAARVNVQKEGPTDTEAMKSLLGAEQALRGSMMNFFALAESYPELRASENMKQLQEELSSTENKIGFARQAYNDQVMAYNIAQEQFPTTLVAGVFGHHPAELFVVDNEEAKKAVKVSF